MGEKKSITQDLLSFDLDSVVEEGKKKERKSRNKKIAAIAVGSVLCLAVILGLVYTKVIVPQNQYNDAVALSEQGEYQSAIDEFEALGDFKDSADMVFETKYRWAESLLADKSYDEAYAKFKEIQDYSDAASRMNDVRYAEAEECLANKDFDDAYSLFNALGSFNNAEARTAEVNYLWAEEYLAEDNLEKALELFTEAGNYGDAKTRAAEVYEMMQIHATAVKLNKTSLTISKGKTAELSATLEPADTTDTIVSWTSSDEKVATVDENGVVTAVSAGNTVIEVRTTNDLTALCKVTTIESEKNSSKSSSTDSEPKEAIALSELTEQSFQGSWVSRTVPNTVYQIFEFNGLNFRHEIYYGGKLEYVKVYTGTFKLIDAKYTDKALFFKESKQETFWPDGRYELYEIPEGFSGEWSPRPITEFTGTSYTTSNVLKYYKTTELPQSPLKEWGFN